MPSSYIGIQEPAGASQTAKRDIWNIDRGGATIGRDRFEGFALRHALSHPLEQMAAMASLVLEGALNRDVLGD